MNLDIGNIRLWVFAFEGILSRHSDARNEPRLHARCETMLRFLVRGPWNRVAVISSRGLDELAGRVPVPKVLLGGANGLEWELPGGYRTYPTGPLEKILEIRRRAISSLLKEIASIPGVDVEDRSWSVVISHRNASPRSFRRRTLLLQMLRNRLGIKVYRGNGVVEIQMVPGGSKSAGVRRLCRLSGWNTAFGEIVYAGGDENDATAMKWVLLKGGSAYVVGDGITVPESRYVEGPSELASEIYAHSMSVTKHFLAEIGMGLSG